MGFSRMIELLQIKNKGKIVICNAENFYIVVSKDAVLLNNLLNLKVTCFKTEICKVRFPINSLEKYTDLIQQKEYSYIVYYFDKEKSNLEIYIGKNKNEIKEGRLTMNLCILLERIISKIDFKFIITGRNVSMAIFKLEVNKNSNVIVKWKL